MREFPNFATHGYQITKELGRNYLGGRATYLALNTTNELVVIKQFQFANFTSDWSGFKAYEREIYILQQLNHPGIPRYIDSFETADGFCMVQEHKNAQSLAVPRTFTPDEIKQIASSILEILVYLQSCIPIVIHRDIKPENILVAQSNVYLVDFGFARIGTSEMALSSVTLGTLGFMPPEQIYNRQLTEATDLYSLGMTLICLLTKTKSTAIETLIDTDNKINFNHLVPHLSVQFIDWLEKLVQPNPKNRYANAAAALEALEFISVWRLPAAHFSTSTLEFTATKLQETLTQTITITNTTPGTLLTGTWEVAPHPSDPPHTPETHAWISFEPPSFWSNHVKCKVTVATNNLLPDQTYTRQLLLHTSASEIYSLLLKMQTLRIKSLTKTPRLLLSLIYVTSGLLTYMTIMAMVMEVLITPVTFVFILLGCFGGAVGGASIKAVTTNKRIIDWQKLQDGAIHGGVLGTLLIVGAFIGLGNAHKLSFYANENIILAATLMMIGILAPVIELNLIMMVKAKMRHQGFKNKFIYKALILAVGAGVISTISLIGGFRYPLAFLGMLSTVPFAKIVLPNSQQKKLLRQSRRRQNLIKP